MSPSRVSSLAYLANASQRFLSHLEGMYYQLLAIPTNFLARLENVSGESQLQHERPFEELDYICHYDDESQDGYYDDLQVGNTADYENNQDFDSDSDSDFDSDSDSDFDSDSDSDFDSDSDSDFYDTKVYDPDTEEQYYALLDRYGPRFDSHVRRNHGDLYADHSLSDDLLEGDDARYYYYFVTTVTEHDYDGDIDTDDSVSVGPSAFLSYNENNDDDSNSISNSISISISNSISNSNSNSNSISNTNSNSISISNSNSNSNSISNSNSNSNSNNNSNTNSNININTNINSDSDSNSDSNSSNIHTVYGSSNSNSDSDDSGSGSGSSDEDYSNPDVGVYPIYAIPSLDLDLDLDDDDDNDKNEEHNVNSPEDFDSEDNESGGAPLFPPSSAGDSTPSSSEDNESANANVDANVNVNINANANVNVNVNANEDTIGDNAASAVAEEEERVEQNLDGASNKTEWDVESGDQTPQVLEFWRQMETLRLSLRPPRTVNNDQGPRFLFPRPPTPPPETFEQKLQRLDAAFKRDSTCWVQQRSKIAKWTFGVCEALETPPETWSTDTERYGDMPFNTLKNLFPPPPPGEIGDEWDRQVQPRRTDGWGNLGGI